MVDINPINPQSVTVNVPSNGSLTVNNTGGSTAQVSTNADAQLAYSWACGVGLIQGIDYSAKYWAGKAKESELIAVNAIQDIEDAKDDAIAELESAKDDAIAELESAKDTCLNDIELAGDNKVAEIEGLASDYESTLTALTQRAETAANNAETSETNAANSATSASTSATNASNSATSAATNANLALGYKNDAYTYANNAAQAKTTAETAASNAEFYWTQTYTAAGQASDSATSARQSASTAQQAKTTAENAVSAAEGYAQQAEQAKEDIEAELDNYVQTSELTTVLADYVLSSDLSTTLADYATQQWAQTNANALYSAMKNWVNNQGFALSSNLASVATSGSYNDLADKPYIPSGVVVDQTFDGTSQNAQSGVAIAGAGFLKNTATGGNSLSILGTASTKSGSVNIGALSETTTLGTAIGAGANVKGIKGVAIGQYATCSTNSDSAIAIGCEAKSTADHTIAIGELANANAAYAIQIGRGTNSTAQTLQVRSYTLLDTSTGLIPDARIPSNIARTSAIPTVPTNVSAFTNDAGYLTSIPSRYLQNIATGSDSLSLLGTSSSENYSINIGRGTSIKSSYQIAIGYSAKCESASNNGAIAIGGYAAASAIGAASLAIGHYAKANNSADIAIGYEAICTSSSCIQIGYGTNSTANTLSIGFYNDSSTHYNWQLLDGTTGLIPDARISTNIARASQIITPTYDSTNERITW